LGFLELDRRIRVVVTANFVAVAARMSVVTFLGIYFVRVAGISLATVGIAFLLESLLRGAAAPMFGALSDRVGRRALLLAAALITAAVLPSFLLVSGTASLLAWSTAMGVAGAANMPVATALLLDLSPAERRQSVLAVNYTGMSVAYTLGVMPAGYVAEQGYGLLAIISSVGYVLVAALYAVALRGALPVERSRGDSRLVTDLLSVACDRAFIGFAALAFIFPFAMGQVVTASPLFAADQGLAEGYIGLVLGGNSIIVALLAVPVASRIEPMGPFRVLGAAAALVAAGFVCYALFPGAAAAYMAGTVVFSFGEIYQGGWTLVQSLSMGSALFLSGLLRESIGWRGAWLLYAVLTLAVAAVLFATRERFQRTQNG